MTAPENAAQRCPEHDRPLVTPRQTGALAVVLGWHESTVVHACEARLEMNRAPDDAMNESAVTVKHDRTMNPHSQWSSFTCPACIQRCHQDDQGRGELGRVHISKNAERWAQEDGYAD